MRGLERAVKIMIRWICRVALGNGKTSEEIRNRLDIVSVSDLVRQGRLRWFGHVERKDADWVSAYRNRAVSGQRGRVRGRKHGRSTWQMK